MKNLLIALLCLQLLIIQGAFAQETGNSEEDFVKNTQEDIVTVAAAGAAGAILGLSTLSFVDRPSEHLGNIWTGAAIGVIAGVVWVAYNSAQKGSEDLESEASVDFNSHERVAWHQKNVSSLTMPSVQFGTGIWSQSF